jgi:hypothetical protein
MPSRRLAHQCAAGGPPGRSMTYCSRDTTLSEQSVSWREVSCRSPEEPGDEEGRLIWCPYGPHRGAQTPSADAVNGGSQSSRRKTGWYAESPGKSRITRRILSLPSTANGHHRVRREGGDGEEDCGVYKIEGSAADNQAVRLVGEARSRGVGARATWRRSVRAEPGVEPPRDPSPQALHGALDETAGQPAARQQSRDEHHVQRGDPAQCVQPGEPRSGGCKRMDLRL